MRLWTLHPKYLDRQGLTAVWREGLLAQKVLSGRTRGYRNHPQLIRFRKQKKPISAMGAYLVEIQEEAAQRGYSFDRRRIKSAFPIKPIPVTRDQLKFEWRHLLAKLKKRDRKKFRELLAVKRPRCHPVFKIIAGEIEDWERNTSRITGKGIRRRT